MAWTQRTIEKLPTPPATYGPRDYADPLFDGLYLTVSPARGTKKEGAKAWTIKYRLGGKRHRYTLARWPAVGIADARKLAKAALLKVAQGTDPHAERAAERAGAAADNFTDLVVDYITRYARPRNRSWIEQARQLGLRLNQHDRKNLDAGQDVPQLRWFIVEHSVAERWRKISVHQLSTLDITRALDDAFDRQGPIAANRLLSGLKGFLNWLVGRGQLKVSPAAGMKDPSPEVERERVLDDTELAAVWRAALAEPAPYGPYVKFLALLGQRRGETAAMRRSWIQRGTVDGFTGTLLRVPPEVAKNGKAHLVPLPRLALDILDDMPPSDGELVFETKRGPLSGYTDLKKRIDTRVSESGLIVDPYTLHDFRRTAASGMARIGVPPHIIEAILNHKSGQIRGIAKVYNRHKYLPEAAEALEAWSAHISKLVV